jgi:hypothetical protein
MELPEKLPVIPGAGRLLIYRNGRGGEGSERE